MENYTKILWESYSDKELIGIYTSSDHLESFKRSALLEYQSRLYKKQIQRVRSEKL